MMVENNDYPLGWKTKNGNPYVCMIVDDTKTIRMILTHFSRF